MCSRCFWWSVSLRLGPRSRLSGCSNIDISRRRSVSSAQANPPWILLGHRQLRDRRPPGTRWRRWYSRRPALPRRRRRRTPHPTNQKVHAEGASGTGRSAARLQKPLFKRDSQMLQLILIVVLVLMLLSFFGG